MVALSEQYNFASVIDEFVALKSFTGPNGDFLKSTIRTRAIDLLTHPDIRYMPAFKLLDLLAEMVNTAAEISKEHQLRRNEATALLQSHVSDHSPLIAQFMLEAALERARYEPMILDATGADALAYRNLTLSKRWEAMLAAHQVHHTLPDEWTRCLTEAVAHVICAQAFAEYRVGPLLQMFAEMLEQARHLRDNEAPLAQLNTQITEGSPLWKRYALKNARFRERETNDPHAPHRALPTQSRIPPIPVPSKHSLH